MRSNFKNTTHNNIGEGGFKDGPCLDLVTEAFEGFNELLGILHWDLDELFQPRQRELHRYCSRIL